MNLIGSWFGGLFGVESGATMGLYARQIRSTDSNELHVTALEDQDRGRWGCRLPRPETDPPSEGKVRHISYEHCVPDRDG